MAASKPISSLTYIKTFLISLKNNLGTLTFVLGCFPFDIQPYHSMSDNLKIILYNSESTNSPIKPLQSPDMYKIRYSYKL